MKVVFATLALAALVQALPAAIKERQFTIGDPEVSFPEPITEPPVELEPDTPVLLPPIGGPVEISGRNEASDKDDEFIIFPPITGPMIPDKPVTGGPMKPDPVVPGKPIKPSA
ncbi:hypothetical protein DL766_010326 [Monosporascus sp. MC13-8B]|uniref:Uncharacterized protein n=1 Tax=Monosporascus cannonballus TaxID=155416 RepID=A0ABY0HBB3_9PEZI|nr:hypothetical protein DL763_006449 [Monosporascus cannonballus]RYO89134.1 hypothetical protein DL762_003414 [Monosporascus cannonballus]RYP02499.1 hypothetical protein DL766_010326 [Monosporascus sp. MC13-8B]